MKLKPNLPPTQGTCNVSHLEIRSLVDQVTVSCTNWIDPDSQGDGILQYHIVVDQQDPFTFRRDWYTVYEGAMSTFKFHLSPWFDMSNEIVLLQVHVIDVHYARTLALET